MLLEEYLHYIQEERESVNEILIPIVVLAYKIYQRFWSKAAIHCRGKKRKEKTICMLEYKLKVLYKTKAEVAKFSKACRQWSTSVDKCLENVRKQLQRLDEEIKEVKEKLQEEIKEHTKETATTKSKNLAKINKKKEIKFSQ